MESYLTAEISASAVRWNLECLRKRLVNGAKVCAVVKADCYGHGLSELLPVITESADCLAVATPEEAIHLRRVGYSGPAIIFFSACALYDDKGEIREALEELIRHHVTLTVVSPADVLAVEQAAAAAGVRAAVHVKIDSGMGRSGVLPDAVVELANRLRASRTVQLTGLYTHFATSDSSDKTFALFQLSRFLRSTESFGRAGLTFHAANSAAAIDIPQSHLDMIRPGISVYGYHPSDQMHNRPPLKPVLRLTGRLMQLRTVAAGSSCGYGLTCTFSRETRLGLVPVGYADGYPRCLSNRTQMQVRGRYVPTCGRVSMDQVVIDVTDVPEARIGDQVEIISPDPKAPNSVENLARLAETIPYEITVRLGRRVRRVLVD